MTELNTLRFHFATVNASLRLSGMEPTLDVLDQQRRILAGEITIDEAINELHRKYTSAQNDPDYG